MRKIKSALVWIWESVNAHPVRWASVIVAFVAIGLVARVLYLIYFKGYLWPAWTGFAEYTSPNANYLPAKTLWDWLELLVIPAVLALAAFYFNRQEHRNELAIAEQRVKADREIATDRQKESALQAYLDKMTELLLKEGLRASNKDDEVRAVARARTLTTLRGLDGERKGVLLNFLYESNLILSS